MKVRYIYSACIVIETPDCRICCDPWFTQGIYEGSWYQYPPIKDPVAAIGQIDFVYVSHIHPDHYDPPFLRTLLRANPECGVLVGTENQDFLVSKMRRDGFRPLSVSKLSKGLTELAIFPNFADDEINIDSALAVKSSGLTVVNMNDCPFDERQVSLVREFCGAVPDLACLPYAGAGPYPQMYRFGSETARILAVENKKRQFLQLFGRYLDALEPRFAMPFAGLYYLGGPLRTKNVDRGVPDAIEVKREFGDSVLVLEEDGGEIDLTNNKITRERLVAFNQVARDVYLSQFDSVLFPYELTPSVGHTKLTEILAEAHSKAITRVKNPPDRTICFQLNPNQFLCLRSDHPGSVIVTNSVNNFSNREIIEIDERLLHGLLTRRFHWNNAEIGSHFSFSRFPDVYDRSVYNLLNFLHI